MVRVRVLWLTHYRFPWVVGEVEEVGHDVGGEEGDGVVHQGEGDIFEEFFRYRERLLVE